MRYWACSISQEGLVTSISGIVGKESTSEISESYQALPKNKGRSNATTAYQQAYLEKTSLYKAKLDKKGYKASIEEAEGYESDAVQLAHDYTKGKNSKKIKWGCVDVQPKLDGVRCKIIYDEKTEEVRAFSRQGKEYTLPSNIEKELLDIFCYTEHRVLDGEIYTHLMDFEDITSRIKDPKHPERNQLCFYLYDIIDTKMTWLERKAEMEKFNISYKSVILVQSHSVNSEEEALSWLEIFVGDSFEGLMFRNHSGLYKCGGRSYDLQKWKLFQDSEFYLSGIELDKRGHAVFIFNIEGTDLTFKARWKASDDKRLHAALNQSDYINTSWNVRFQKYSAYGIPIFPVAIAKRDYE